MTTSEYLWTPEGFDLGGLLDVLDPDLLEDKEYRIGVTKWSPVRFALVYLPHHLRSRETKMRHSLNKVHLHIASNAIAWTHRYGPAMCRKATIAPRQSGKSTWDFIICPIWAMAHGHRTFPALFSDGGKQAQVHFRSMKREFEANARLREDFPDLCTPATRRGNRADIDNATEYHSKSGHTIMAKGINAKSLGLKSGDMGNERPDTLLLDDVEPMGSVYSRDQKKKRLATIVEGILPMNDSAPVEIVGTTTMYDSIIHDLVRAANGGEVADWIIEENFRPTYFPAIEIGPNGEERSVWPQKWSYNYLQAQRGTRTFALNFMNMPMSAGKGYWETRDFQYNFPWTIAEQILSIDPAVTSRETSDYTGISVIGMDASRQNVVVEWARGVRLGPEATRNVVHHIINTNPMISTVIVETNNGGDWVSDRFLPFPRRLQYLTPREHLPKHERISQLHDYYQRKWVWHVAGLTALEEQEVAYPDVDHDDIVDSVAKGVHHVLQHRPIPRSG